MQTAQQLEQGHCFLNENFIVLALKTTPLSQEERFLRAEGGFTFDFAEAWRFNDEMKACRKADQLAESVDGGVFVVFANYRQNDQREIYTGRPSTVFLYRDNEHAPDLDDTVEVYSSAHEPEEAKVTRIGKQKLRVVWTSDFIKPRSAWVLPADCELIARAG